MEDHKLAAGAPGARSRRGTTLAWVMVGGALLTLGALVFIWQRYQFLSLGFEVSALRERRAALSEQIKPLEVEAEYLSRPERIEALARERLGLQPPAPGQVIVVEPAGREGR